MLSFILLELSFSDIVSDIPLNAGTIIVLLLFGIFGGFIWYGSRSSRSSDAPSSPPRGPSRAEGADALERSGTASR